MPKPGEIPREIHVAVIALLAMLLGFVAWKLPRVREIHCYKCGWRTTLHWVPGPS